MLLLLGLLLIFPPLAIRLIGDSTPAVSLPILELELRQLRRTVQGKRTLLTQLNALNRPTPRDCARLCIRSLDNLTQQLKPRLSLMTPSEAEAWSSPAVQESEQDSTAASS
eukprot:SAG31_NODE_23098_length_511_cov_1.004854_1_plen_110_part_10